MQSAMKKIAVLGIVLIFAILAGLASAQYTQTPTQPTSQNNTAMQTNNSTNNSNITMNQTMNQSTNQTMNMSGNVSLNQLTTMNLSQNEINDSMIQSFLSTNTNRMVNQTNSQNANVSQAFLFKNHLVVITVINNSVNVTNIVQVNQINQVVNQVLIFNINKLINQTNKPLSNGSHAFRFKNHTIIINVINESHTRNIICKPELKIDEPKEGATLSHSNVTIVSNYTNFSVIPHFGERDVKGQGHLHYFKDVTAPTTQGQPATTTNGTWAQSAVDMYNWTNLTPGRHAFSVELVQNDHTPLSPPVVATVNVTIQSPNNISTTQITTTTAITISISVLNNNFNQSTFSIPAGAMVTFKFQNKDRGKTHTIVISNSSNGMQIFRGQTTTGPSMTTMTFKAPNRPGTLIIRDEANPAMKGTVVVH
jgi:hypothetical protein